MDWRVVTFVLCMSIGLCNFGLHDSCNAHENKLLTLVVFANPCTLQAMPFTSKVGVFLNVLLGFIAGHDCV